MATRKWGREMLVDALKKHRAEQLNKPKPRTVLEHIETALEWNTLGKAGWRSLLIHAKWLLKNPEYTAKNVHCDLCQ